MRTWIDSLVIPIPSNDVDELHNWDWFSHKLLFSHILQNIGIPFVVVFVLLVFHLDSKVSNENCLFGNFQILLVVEFRQDVTFQVLNAQPEHLNAIKNHLELLSNSSGRFFIPLKLDVISVLDWNNTPQKIPLCFLFFFGLLSIFIFVVNKIIKAIKMMIFTVNTGCL